MAEEKIVMIAHDFGGQKSFKLIFENEDDMLLYTKNRGMQIVVDEVYIEYIHTE